MSVRFGDALGEGLIRSADLLDFNSPYTIMGYVYYLSNRGGDYGAFYCGHLDSAAFSVDFAGLEPTPVHVVEASLDPADSTITGAAISYNTWYHLAVVRESATSLKLYINNGTPLVATTNITGRSAIVRMNMGQRFMNGANETQMDGRIAAVKAWAAALNTTEIAAEMGKAYPVRTANLYAWWPLQVHTDLSDSSGNGRGWTARGTLSTEADPPGVSFSSASAAVGGTGGDGMSESEVVAGGQIITLTLTGDTFIP